MAATGVTAALTTRLQEQSLNDGRTTERTHCCRIREAMTENGLMLPNMQCEKDTGRRMRKPRFQEIEMFVSKSYIIIILA